MDGSQGLVAVGIEAKKRFPALISPVHALVAGVEGLSARHAPELESIVITKTVPGFSTPVVSALRALVREASAGRLGRLKYVVFELAHDSFALSTADEGFTDLLVEIETLILHAPTISAAFVRADLAGADLEFALACSLIVSRRDARFSFAADPLVSIGAYALLAQKIGFVLAERLMEEAEVLDAARMYELCLVKELVDTETLAEGYLAGALRKHNAACGIYRAQRIAARSAHEALRAARLA